MQVGKRSTRQHEVPSDKQNNHELNAESWWWPGASVMAGTDIVRSVNSKAPDIHRTKVNLLSWQILRVPIANLTRNPSNPFIVIID